jgi:hypothetical protein
LLKLQPRAARLWGSEGLPADRENGGKLTAWNFCLMLFVNNSVNLNNTVEGQQ